ncbi:MAG TPA: DMT family transporter [Trebonia sp.]
MQTAGPRENHRRPAAVVRVQGDERPRPPIVYPGGTSHGGRTAIRAEPAGEPLFPLIAVLAGFGSALAYAITAVTEQLSTKRVKRRRALSPELLLDLVKQPLWLAGVAANVASLALQVVALRFGPLALVEPILVCDMIFAGLISAAMRKRADPVTGAGVLACAAGVAGFLVIARPSAGRDTMGFIEALPLLAGFAALLVGCLVLARWNQTARPLALALACGAAYAVTDFSIKLATGEFSGGLPPVLAIITITDTIGAIGLGWLFLNEKLSSGPAEIAGQAASLLVMTVGIVVLAHRSPQAAAARAQAAGTQDQAAATRDQPAATRDQAAQPADQADGEPGVQ